MTAETIYTGAVDSATVGDVVWQVPIVGVDSGVILRRYFRGRHAECDTCPDFPLVSTLAGSEPFHGEPMFFLTERAAVIHAIRRQLREIDVIREGVESLVLRLEAL